MPYKNPADRDTYPAYDQKPAVKKARAARNKARAMMEREGNRIELNIDLTDFRYPYTRETAAHLGAVFASSGIPSEWLQRLRDTVQSKKAEEVLLLTSALVGPTLENLMAGHGFRTGGRLHVRIPRNSYFGGNIFMGDLLVVHDFIETIEEFIKQELPDLLQTVSDLYRTTNLQPLVIPEAAQTGGSEQTSHKQPTKLEMTSGTIAAKLNCSSGPELVISACASLTLVKCQDTFTRQQIHDEMKLASAYYKSSYGSNLVQHLNSLVKSGKLLERAAGRYALPASRRSDLESQLAN